MTVPSDVASRPPSEENASAEAVVSTPEAAGPAKLRWSVPSCALQSVDLAHLRGERRQRRAVGREGRPRRSAPAAIRAARSRVQGSVASEPDRPGAGPRRQPIAGRRERHLPARSRGRASGSGRSSARPRPARARSSSSKVNGPQATPGAPRRARGAIGAPPSACRAPPSAPASGRRRRDRPALVSACRAHARAARSDSIVTSQRPPPRTSRQSRQATRISDLQTTEESSWFNVRRWRPPPVRGRRISRSAMKTMIRLQAASAGTNSRN